MLDLDFLIRCLFIPQYEVLMFTLGIVLGMVCYSYIDKDFFSKDNGILLSYWILVVVTNLIIEVVELYYYAGSARLEFSVLSLTLQGLSRGEYAYIDYGSNLVIEIASGLLIFFLVFWTLKKASQDSEKDMFRCLCLVGSILLSVQMMRYNLPRTLNVIVGAYLHRDLVSSAIVTIFGFSVAAYVCYEPKVGVCKEITNS